MANEESFTIPAECYENIGFAKLNVLIFRANPFVTPIIMTGLRKLKSMWCSIWDLLSSTHTRKRQMQNTPSNSAVVAEAKTKPSFCWPNLFAIPKNSYQRPQPLQFVFICINLLLFGQISGAPVCIFFVIFRCCSSSHRLYFHHWTFVSYQWSTIYHYYKLYVAAHTWTRHVDVETRYELSI